jgi:hypothetical protein
MPQDRSRPEGYMCQGNPRKWHGNGTMDSYIADKSRYIYWATPQCRDDIRVEDKAFIWRSVGGVGSRGIIAIGTVAELPREYSRATLSQFRHPHLVGIGEEAASSKWKTGISLSEVRLREKTGMLTAQMLVSVCPNLRVLRMPQGTVYRLSAEEIQTIEALWASTHGIYLKAAARFGSTPA